GAADEGSAEARPHVEPPVFGIDLPQRPDRPQRPGVVHEHRDAIADLVLDRDDCIADRTGIGDVGDGADSRPSTLEDQAPRLLELRARSGHEPDSEPVLGESDGDGPSDAPPCSSDDGDRARCHGARSRSPCSSSVAAASRTARYGSPDRSAIARRSWLPSERLNTQSSGASGYVPSGTLWYRP